MGVKIQTIKDIRICLAKELVEIYTDQEISTISSIIINTVTGVKRLQQFYMPEKKVNRGHAGRIFDICKELKTGKPLQYILGETFFFDCIIKVNNSTLIPRPETEELVDLIIRENKNFQGNIIDIGTGSGCIAIALAANLPGSLVTGADISDDAIRTAQENAVLNNVKVSFIKYDVFSSDIVRFEKADIIVSNPPYVRLSEKQYMNKNVLDFEPALALFVDDSDPLKYYRAILEFAEKILVPGGKVYFEINEAMGTPMVQLLSSYRYSEVYIIEDLNRKDRIIKGTKDV
jgi:release factor glutamine methyltransferase